MTDRELKRLSRRELIDIIYELQLEHDAMQKELSERAIVLSESGSIAEASLKLNKVFEAAEAAAEQYLISVKASAADIEEKVQRTNEQCQAVLQKTDAECSARLEAAEKEIARKWDTFQKKAAQLIQEHSELRTLLGGEAKTGSTDE